MNRFRATGQPTAEELLAVLDAMPTDIAIGQAIRAADGTIEDFELVFMNEHSEDALGRRAAQLVGGRVCELYPAWRSSGMFDLFVQVVETGQTFEDKAFRYFDIVDGEEIDGWWSITVQPFRDGYLAISSDAEDEVLAAAEAAANVEARAAVDVLQAVALPVRLPSLPGLEVEAVYQPAQLSIPIGGDWYDGFRRPDGKVGLVVGDVSGHGQRAATVMVRISNLVHYLALADRAPAEVLQTASEVVVDTWNGFATCCFAMLDPDTGEYEWASAGHPPPVILAGDGPSVLPWETNSPPLGVMKPSSVASHKGRLRDGESLVLYTDGLVERKGYDLIEDVWTLARVMHDQRDRPIHELVGSAVTGATGGGATDDLCVLVARLTAVGQGAGVVAAG